MVRCVTNILSTIIMMFNFKKYFRCFFWVSAAISLHCAAAFTSLLLEDDLYLSVNNRMEINDGGAHYLGGNKQVIHFALAPTVPVLKISNNSSLIISNAALHDFSLSAVFVEPGSSLILAQNCRVRWASDFGTADAKPLTLQIGNQIVFDLAAMTLRLDEQIKLQLAPQSQLLIKNGTLILAAPNCLEGGETFVLTLKKTKLLLASKDFCLQQGTLRLAGNCKILAAHKSAQLRFASSGLLQVLPHATLTLGSGLTLVYEPNDNDSQTRPSHFQLHALATLVLDRAVICCAQPEGIIFAQGQILVRNYAKFIKAPGLADLRPEVTLGSNCHLAITKHAVLSCGLGLRVK